MSSVSFLPCPFSCHSERFFVILRHEVPKNPLLFSIIGMSSFASLRTASERQRRISSVLSCHSEGALATEESPQETLRAKALRVTNKKPQDDKKGVILSFFFVILTLSRSPELMRRGSEGEESHPFT